MFEFRHGSLHVESPAELARLAGVAGEMGRRAPVSFRVNPDVDARTHTYISTGLKESKFGIAFDAARERERPEALFALEHILR